MARMNKKAPTTRAPKTHEGGLASRIPASIPGGRIDAVGKVVRVPISRPLEQLRRSVLACLLWEDEFYESGREIATRIVDAAQDVSIHDLASLCVEARTVYNLRSAPMLLLSILVERWSKEKPAINGSGLQIAIEQTIQRADELTELLAIYWRNGKRPLTAQLKKGLARAFRKFDAYQLAKYDRANAIRLRDVLFLVHAKPKACPRCNGTKFVAGDGELVRCVGCLGDGRDAEQAELWSKLVDGTLEPPLTWEVELSKGGDKKDVFERLLREGKLGYLALLRNLRNMVGAGVDGQLIIDAIAARKGAHRVLPFRYVAAARAVPNLEPFLDRALVASLAEMPVLPGRTAVLVDVSGSMDAPLSEKGDLKRMDAAATLASIIPDGSPHERPFDVSLRVFTFSTGLVEVAPRRGMAGVDAVIRSQEHGGTYLAAASRQLAARVDYDRLIVVTDEQSQDGKAVLRPGARGYLINLASAQNGVNYEKPWVHFTGFSENILRFVAEYERFEAWGDNPG